MQVLFAISIVCFVVLVWAAVAIVDHVRMSHRRSRTASQPHRDFSHHLIAAAQQRDIHLPPAVRLQSVQEIAAHKSWNVPSTLVEIPPAAGVNPMLGKRKSPQSAHHRAEERLDWAYFNKDYGDLTDPYSSPRIRVSAGTKPTSIRRS
ncbi:hypothetical protein [Edaphobacter bradus]|uniref:hypothetical protein n=1 Tax=Edaphobacter bradus TaxID=2259016 RepID=UPI0021E0551B|nr:hypothetical protein [Edaphobacter bradus]